MKQAILAGMVLMAGLVATCEAVTRYVSLDGGNADPYTNWAMAARNIDSVITANGDMIIVSNGVYNRSARVSLQYSVTVSGLYGAAQTVFNGGSGNFVGFYTYNNSTCKVYGVTITNCFMGGVGVQGGSTFNFDSCIVSGNSNDPTGGGFTMGPGDIITNCVISGNTAGDRGGGIFFSGTGSRTGRVDNSVINSNRAVRFGSGILAEGTGVIIIQNCTSAYNVCSGTGDRAAIYASAAGSRLANSVIINNSGSSGAYFPAGTLIENCTVACNSNYYDNGGGNGGGINSAGTVFNCLVANNTSTLYGGGIYSVGGVISNCAVVSNATMGISAGVASRSGGGIYGGVSIRNCLVANNRVESLSYGGGGIESGGIIANCTIASNYSGSAGGGVSGANTSINSIVYFNNSAGASSNYAAGTFSNSCTAPNPTGSGNTTANPQFVDLSGGNFHLLRGSPCINTGLYQSWMDAALDLDGRPRIREGLVDMGAYESFPKGTVLMIQ